MDKIKLLYEGKAKKIFETNNKSEIIIEFKNDITAFNSIKHDVLENKGNLCAEISHILFKYLNAHKIPNQFIKKIDPISFLCKKLKMIPLEVILRNTATGSIVRNYPIKQGTKFNPPIIQFFLKDEEYKDPLITERHIYAMNIANEKQIDDICKLTLDINKHLLKLFNEVDIDLIDMKLEFGLNEKNEIILGDELSPDNMRLVDKKTNKMLDKEVYRQNVGDPMQTYNEVLKRISKCLQ